MPGFEPALRADIQLCADWFTLDADGQHGRVNVKGFAKTASGPHNIDFAWTGILAMTEAVQKIFGQAPDAKTAPFGAGSGTWTFRTGDPALKVLSDSSWVSSHRLVVNADGTMTVEARVSRAVLPEVMD